MLRTMPSYSDTTLAGVLLSCSLGGVRVRCRTITSAELPWMFTAMKARSSLWIIMSRSMWSATSAEALAPS